MEQIFGTAKPLMSFASFGVPNILIYASRALKLQRNYYAAVLFYSFRLYLRCNNDVSKMKKLQIQFRDCSKAYTAIALINTIAGLSITGLSIAIRDPALGCFGTAMATGHAYVFRRLMRNNSLQ